MLKFGSNFDAFCERLRIESKEFGLVPLRTYGTQKYFLDELRSGLAGDIHDFTILKGRQQGISTIMLAVDLYCAFKVPGLQATLVTDTDDNRDGFRATLANYMRGLPPEWKLPIRSHNRNHLVLKNRSRLSYLVAGTRKKGGLGRGKGISYAHLTECSSFGDEEGLASLQASFAQIYPDRLFVKESTARGYNMFHDMWETAKHARTQKAIFIGWWRHELYAIPEDDVRYQVYWDGLPTGDERDWMERVKMYYGHDITPNQIAWWRWMAEEIIGDMTMMKQEHPPTEDEAFVLSGSTFFNGAMLSRLAKTAEAKEPAYFRYDVGLNIEDLELIRTNDPNASLRVWREPEDGGIYAMGCDPAYGSSDWKDRYCISIWRCWADGMEQVAEYATSDGSTYSFAWIICHLAGFYRVSNGGQMILEINGPGQAVFDELMRMRSMSGQSGHAAASIYDIAASINHHLWRRADTFGGPTAFHWKSDTNAKSRMMNGFSDAMQRGELDVSSLDMLEECKTVVREDGFIGAPGRKHKDDRVIAAALAVMAWTGSIRPNLVGMRLTRASTLAEREEKDRGARANVLGNGLHNFLQARGLARTGT